MSSYPVPSCAASSMDREVPGGGALMVAVRVSDLVSPVRNGRPLGEGDRSALVIAGTEQIRTGDQVVFLKLVAAAPAQLRRDGRVQAQGSPCEHATLGPLEDWLEQQAGPGVIDEIAERAVLREDYVKGVRKRLLSRAFVIRAIVLMTLLPDADAREAVIALAGDLAVVPWARAWRPASPRAFGDWRAALGPQPLEELRDIVLGASHAEHEDRDWRAVIIGGLKVSSADGTLIRVPDTPANRAAFGSTGTGDDSAPFPQIRALPLNDASTRGLLGMPHGPAGTDKAAAGQKLLDTAMEEYPHLFTRDRIWLLDRNFPGTARIARLIARTHVLIRLKSDIPLKMISPILPDGSYIAEISGDGVTVTVRVIEYYVHVEGQVVPEMFCLITNLTDIGEYPAIELAALYKWRWDGSGDRPAGDEILPGRRRPVSRADAPLANPGPGPAGTRRLGRGHRDDPRHRARCRPRRGARPERAPGRAARPAPRDPLHRHPPRRHRRDPPRQDRLRRPDQRTRQTPHDNRQEPAPCPQGEMPQRLRARQPRGHRHPHRPGRHHPRQQARLTSGTATAARDLPEKLPAGPVEPGRCPARHAGPQHAPGRELPTVTRTSRPAPPAETTQTPKAHGIAPRAAADDRGPG